MSVGGDDDLDALAFDLAIASVACPAIPVPGRV
jgi:hypothetical protein